jgi:hypothetical protein
MAVAIQLDIDLAFSVTSGENELSGTVKAAGSEIEVFLAEPTEMLAGRRSLASVRQLALELAKRGVVVSVSGPSGLLAKIGAVKAPVGDRMLTGSKHIRTGSIPGLMAVLRAKPTAESPAFLPPSTLLPLAPTVERNKHPKITTTHYTPGSGRPRLIFVIGSETWNGEPPREFELGPGVTTIGSAPGSDLQLEGLDPAHAEIRHDKDDEYVLYTFSTTPGVFPVLEPDTGKGRVLRTGARIELGEWRMAYFREEFADHGRPFGGRAGGELAQQKPQAPRQRYQ